MMRPFLACSLLTILYFLQIHSQVLAQDSSHLGGQALPKVQSSIPDHEWHQGFTSEGHDDVMDDESLHDVAKPYKGYFKPSKSGQPAALNLSAVMLGAERQEEKRRHGGLAFIKTPIIPNTVLKRLSRDVILNMTAEDVYQLQRVSEMSYQSLTHLLANLRPEEFHKMLDLARNATDLEMEYLADPSVAKAIVDSCRVQWGPLSGWTVPQVTKLGPFLRGLNIEQIQQLNENTLPVVFETFARQRFPGPAAKTLVLRAKRSWGAVGTWTLERFVMLGPLLTFLNPRDLKQIQLSQDFTSTILPLLGRVELTRAQSRAVINVATSAPDWNWTLQQVESLGKMQRFLNIRELRGAPASVFASPELLKEILPSDGRGHQQQTREIARVLKQNKGELETWDAEDFRSMGRAASGLEVEELKQLDPIAVREALLDIGDADYSPRQRRVLVSKYRQARGNLSKPISAADVRQMKGLAVELSSSDLANMAPEDIRHTVDVFAKNVKKMKKTQQREIINQLKDAPGGLVDAVQDMGDMVKELPLKDLDSLCTANFTASALDGNNTTGVMAAAGWINWTMGQSMKLFRCFKEEVLGESSSNPLTPSTIRYMGNMAKGMSCGDINTFPADDIHPVVGAMMEQQGWSPRQLACTHRHVRAALSSGHTDFTADFTEIEISELTGQLLKEFSLDELKTVPSAHCEMLYSEIGSEDLMILKRNKRTALATDALKCLNMDGETDIEQDTIDVIGNMICDLQSDTLRRLSSSAFTGNLYTLQKCCLDVDQLVVIGERLEQELGPPNEWSSDTISDVGPLLVSLSEVEIQSLEEVKFSPVAEDVMFRFAEYKEKWRHHCEIDLKPVDIGRREEGFVAVATKAKDAFIAAQTENSERKKRQSTYSPTCNEIESLGNGNIVWTVDELQAMTVNTFDSCGYALGEVDGFSDAQRVVLLDKAKEAWGQPSEMTPEQVSQLGRMTSKLTPAEMGQLNITDIDTLYSISQYDIYTSDQLTAGVSRFLELSGVAISSMDAVQLTALGNFLCGMTAVELEGISSSAYQEAANSIGELRTCDSNQWASLKAKAVDGYGSIDTWQPEVFTEVGSVVAGFTSDELSSLSDASIAGIEPHAVALIPPQTLAASWSSTQLRTLDQSQAEAVTDDQLSALSEEQRSAITEAEYGDDVGLADTINFGGPVLTTTPSSGRPVLTTTPSSGPDNGAEHQSQCLVPVILFILLCQALYT